MTVCIIGLQLFILGLSCFQAHGLDNSTQVYYVVLTVERSALQRVTGSLAFRLDSPVAVDSLAVTTLCEESVAGPRCACQSGHRWSARVCERDPSCCQGDMSCVLADAVCHPKNRVTIKGTMRLENAVYYHSMADPSSVKFKELSANLTQAMKPSYSTLRGFDGIHITKFSLGVNVSFEVYVNGNMTTENLRQITAAAVKKLNATITLETEGFVHIQVSKKTVPLNDSVNIVCTSSQTEASVQEWTQTTPREVSQITNGTESDVKSDGARTTTLTLKQTSGIWAGLITCTFKPAQRSVAIVHRASAELDVALLPEINIVSVPQFPLCNRDAIVVAVMVKCEIKNSTEKYDTKWIVNGSRAEVVVGEPDFDRDPLVYSVETAVGCLLEDEANPANVTCVFRNRENQTKPASVQINVIYKNKLFCEAIKDWPNTKAGFTAKLPCKDQSGLRLRKCTTKGKFLEVESQCVNSDLSSIVEEILIINKGLGSVHLKSKQVFSRLTNATNDTKSINTVANLNTSINILYNMQELNNTFSESTLDDILKSSSNILNVSSENVWKPANSTLSMAEKYLTSVEGLIRLTNISQPLSREESNIQIRTCRDKDCDVFNVTVSVGGPRLIKAAGFKKLVQFLPLKSPDYKPNSIVVTANVDGEHRQAPTDITIRFPLTSPRPRNHLMKCIAMDQVQGQWSPTQCTWGGPRDEGSCHCRGRSSSASSAFTTILSDKPVEVPLLAEITQVGLALSITSLVTFLVIECLIWNTVVKTNSLFLRHTTLVNISVSLLVGDCSSLASDFQANITKQNWCKVFVVLKHFFYLAQFCWMFCLSTLLLYQTVFVFLDLNKGRYQGVCYAIGYGVPFLIVTTTFVTHDAGAEGSYYNAISCWLIHHGMLQGSFYSFIIPVGIIVFFNLFSMAIVIVKLLNHPKGGGAGGTHSSRHTTLRILRSIVILTPVFGVTWIFGFATLALDLAADPRLVSVVYYIFGICNSFQGFFILLTAGVGDRMVRDALKKRMSATQPPSSTMDTSLILQSGKVN